MKVEHKTLPVDFKAADDDSGEFTALVSAFGNVDLVGDRMMPGAFASSLERWREKGDPIPVVFNHDWGTPDAHVGVANPANVYESDDGLVVKGQLDIGDNPVAAQIYKLLKRRSLTAFSFGYTVPKGGEKRAKDGANEVFEADLIEVGPTLRGANPEAQLQAVKSAMTEELPTDEVEDEAEDAADESPQASDLPNAIEDADKEPSPAKSLAQDPLRQASRAAALEVLSDGASLHTYTEDIPEPAPEPPTEDAQRRRFCDLYIN